jgi:hypothetical protein
VTAALEVRTQDRSDVNGDHAMVARSTGHGKELPIHILMLDGGNPIFSFFMDNLIISRYSNNVKLRHRHAAIGGITSGKLSSASRQKLGEE